MRIMRRGGPVLLGLLMVTLAEAATIVVGNAPTRVRLRVGAAGGTIDVVSFSLPASGVGSGTPVAGVVTASGVCAANNVLIDAEARATPANSRTATLSVDSSIALSSGADVIPFTEIEWTASGYAPITIPSGAFNGASGQVLASFQNSRRARQCHAFSFRNSQIFGAGTYVGRVTYTLTMP